MPVHDGHAGIVVNPMVMSALGQKQTFAVQKGMSALPQKRTCAVQRPMSALCQKRTFAPQQIATLFDQLVGARDHCWRHGNAQLFCRL